MTDFPVAEREELSEGISISARYEENDGSYANPRDADNLGVMFCDYRGYNLGDDDAPDPRDQSITCPACDGSGETERNVTDEGDYDPETCPKCDGRGEIELDIFEYLKQEHGATVVLPLFLLDHSGLSMRAGEAFGSFDRRNRFVGDGAGWDTSSVGVIFDTNESREMVGTDPEHVEEVLRAEVDEYDSYLRGEIYWWAVEDEDGETLESCGGYLGNEGLKYALEEARATAELEINDRRETRRRNELALACWRD